MTVQTDPLAKYRTQPGVPLPKENRVEPHKSVEAGQGDRIGQSTEADQTADPLAKYRSFPAEKPEVQAKTDKGESIWDSIKLKYQLGAGLAKVVTAPLDILKAAAKGAGREALQPFYEPGEEAEREKAAQIGEQQIEKVFPTQELIEQKVEQATGLPLNPKTTAQKAFRIGGELAPIVPAIPAVVKAGAKKLAGLIRPKALQIAEEAFGPLPTTARTTAAQAVQELQKRGPAYEPPQHLRPGQPIPLPAPGAPMAREIRPQPPLAKTAPQPIQGRITPSQAQTTARPVATARNLEEEVGSLFSPERIPNMTQGGQAIMREVQAIDDQAYREVNRLYDVSREANSAIQDIHPQLVNEINARIDAIEAIPHPSGPQRQLLNLMRDVRGRLAQVDKEGNITGYLPISNQDLINQIQSTHQILDFDFAHGNPKGIFRPFLQDIENSITRTTASSGNQEALQSWNQAREAYSDWARTFDNDYIRPLRNTTNQDYIKTFKKSLDTDEFNVLAHVLNRSEAGQTLNQRLMREIANKHLEKYFLDPRKAIGSREFSENMRELGAVMPEEGVTAIKNMIMQSARRPSIKAKAPTKATKAEPSVQKASKYLEKGEEEILKDMDSVAGLRSLRNDLSKTAAGKKNFETLARHKVRDILLQGNIKKKFTGDELARAITKEKNYEILEEIMGKEKTAALLEAAEKAGKRRVRLETAGEIVKKAVGLEALKYIMPLLP